MGSLITGIGYIGARLAGRLLDSGEPVVGMDNLFSTDTASLGPVVHREGFTFVEGSVSDEQAVALAFDSGVRIDTVYHLAAQASAHPSAARPRYTEETNLIGPRVVLDHACRHGTGVFVFGSSLQLYGRAPSSRRVTEDTPYGPVLDLSHLSKIHAEKLMEMYALTRGIRCLSARIGLVYGLGPVMKTDPRFMTAPNKFCLRAVHGEELRLDAGAYLPTSMVHLDDVAVGLSILAGAAPDGFSAFNLLGETASVAQVAETVRRVGARRGLAVSVVGPDPAPRQPDVEFASGMAGLGYAPLHSLEGEIPALLEHFDRLRRDA